MQIEHKCSWKEPKEKAVSNVLFQQGFLFNHLYYSFCIPATPCGSYLDCSLSKSQYPYWQRTTGVKNSKSENRERTQQQWVAGLLLHLITPEAWKAQVSLAQQRHLPATCDAALLTPEPQLSGQIQRQYCPPCYTSPSGTVHHCQADITCWQESSFIDWASQVFHCNTKLHFKLWYFCLCKLHKRLVRHIQTVSITGLQPATIKSQFSPH